ncbi:MAG TPA: hypothetical protein VN577_20115 [Terriglobales bacterium]|nr:hypothetical protein [Terriglobales bacterium]
MAECRFCGNKAGWFKEVHEECQKRHDQALRDARELAGQAALDPDMRAKFKGMILSIAKDGFLSASEQAQAVVGGLADAVRLTLEDKILSKDEEDRLALFLMESGFEKQIRESPVAEQIAMAGALREVMEGKIPQRVKLPEDHALPFILQADEALVWAFPDVTYLTEKTRRSYVGGTSGASVRVARGLYWRVGAFKGRPIETSSIEAVDTGNLYITSEALYFKGDREMFRAPFRQLIGYEAYDDGIGVWKSNANAKQKLFSVGKGKGWFVYNLVRNLAELEAQPAQGGRVKGFGGASD